MRPTTWTPTYCTLFLVLSRHIWTSFKLDYARLLGVLILLFLVLALTWLTWWVMEWELTRTSYLSMSPLLLLRSSGEIWNLRYMLRRLLLMVLRLLLLAAYEIYGCHLYDWTLCINKGWAITTHLSWRGWSLLTLIIGHESLCGRRNNLWLIQIILVHLGVRVLLLRS